MPDRDDEELARRLRTAVRLAVGAVVVLAVSFGLFGMVWATNGTGDRVAGVVGVGHIAGAITALVAFVKAARARLGQGFGERASRDGTTAGWLPLSLFPVLLAVWLLAIAQGA